MRSTLLTCAATASLSMILTACGGGGSGTTPTAAPASVQAPAASSTPSPVQEINNFTGPSSKVTISFKIPSKPPTPAQAKRMNLASLRAAKVASGHVRTLSNTSPSAALRALGQTKPQYITPYTYYVEFVLTDSSQVVQVDDYAYCGGNSCSMQFDAPIGTGFTGTLYLYDYGYYLVGAGTAGGISVTLGNTTNVPLTVNGVVTYLNILSSNYGPFLDDPSSAATPFTVTPQALDLDGNVLTTPGVLIDSNLYQIGSVTLGVDNDTLPSAPQTLTPQADLSFLGTTYNYQGASQEGSINFNVIANEIGAGPYVPVLYTFSSPYPTQSGSLSITTTPVSLTWNNSPSGYPQSPGDPILTPNGGSGSWTYFNFEFPLATNTNTYTLGLTDTSSAGQAAGITLTDNGACIANSVASYNPPLTTLTPYGFVNGPPYVQITMNSSGATFGCAVYASDGVNTSELDIYTDSSSLLIQGKVRKH